MCRGMQLNIFGCKELGRDSSAFSAGSEADAERVALFPMQIVRQKLQFVADPSKPTSDPFLFKMRNSIKPIEHQLITECD